jgi:CRP/FNR family cyclic AMP-dependent transcriptional regulator
VAVPSNGMALTALNTVQALALSKAVRHLRGGDNLFEAGQPGSTIFAVLKGEVQLEWQEGGVETFQPGQVFGVGALVSADHRRHGTARALVDSEILEMSREEFLFAVQETPMFAVEVMASLEQRLRAMQH